MSFKARTPGEVGCNVDTNMTFRIANQRSWEGHQSFTCQRARGVDQTRGIDETKRMLAGASSVINDGSRHSHIAVAIQFNLTASSAALHKPSCPAFVHHPPFPAR